MTDEENEEIVEFVEPTETETVVDGFRETMGKFIETADIGRVFGEPVRKGEVTIIPAAEMVSGLGFGLGYGGGGGPAGGREAQPGQGGGGGGGGRILARPVAVVVVEMERVRVEPIVDQTKIALAALTAAGFIFTSFLRMRRGDISFD